MCAQNQVKMEQNNVLQSQYEIWSISTPSFDRNLFFLLYDVNCLRYYGFIYVKLVHLFWFEKLDKNRKKFVPATKKKWLVSIICA